MPKVLANNQRKKNTPITSREQIEWEFVFNTDSKESQEAFDEVIETISREGVKKGYFGASLGNKEITEDSTSKALAGSSLVS